MLRQTPRAGFTVLAQLCDSIELLLPTVYGWRDVLDCSLLSIVLHRLTRGTVLINSNRTLPRRACIDWSGHLRDDPHPEATWNLKKREVRPRGESNQFQRKGQH